MKKLLLILLFVFLLSFKAFPQNKWEIKGGLNYTNFVSVKNSSPKIGYTLGIARKIKIYNNFSFSGEVDFVSKCAILKNRKISPYTEVDEQDAYSWDIHGSIGYLEFPILIKYSFPIYKRYNLTLFMGPSYSIPIIDFTKFEKREFLEVYNPDNPSGMVYDYGFGQESGFGNNTTSFIFNFGFDLSYLNYFFELRYVLDNREIYNFSNLSEVYAKVSTFQILFGKTL